MTLFSAAKGAADGLRELLRLEDDRHTVALDADRQYREAQRPDPAPLPVLCHKHDWNPEPPFPGAPRPNASECPECLAERDARWESDPTAGAPIEVSVHEARETLPMALAYDRSLSEQEEAIRQRPNS